MKAMVDAICTELELQWNFMERETVNTVYLGGGTPSLLDEKYLHQLMKTIHYEFPLSSNPEITLEANPDDLKPKRLAEIKKAGINRLSVGLQTFNDQHLQWLNRAHTQKEAFTSIRRAREAGFENISLDLIYAIPSEDHSTWKQDLKEIIRLGPEHISAYCLTIEAKTAFGNWVSKGKMEEVDEEYAAQQFELLLETMQKYGYEQYEISNFAQPGYESQHNSNYWKQEKYLGVGPSAHSYDGVMRQANIANNALYIKSLKEKDIPYEIITLSDEDQINEYILTSLRTKWGVDLDYLQTKYKLDLLQKHKEYLIRISNEGLIEEEDNCLILTNNGKLLADQIAADLFILV